MQTREEHIQQIIQPKISDEAFSQLQERLFKERGLDLDGYKDRCIRRRISVRLRARQCSSLEEYLDVLIQDTEELDNLIHAITINVSEFFRNMETFELIKERIIPSILAWRNKREQKEMNFWSAGCATGEEAYSLAILLRHYFKGPINSMRVFIVGTDFNDSFLELARKGVYSHDRVEDIPEKLKKRYFLKQQKNLELIPLIRDMVTFEKQDLMGAFPAGRFDMILCRNVFIYLSRKNQEKIFERFYETLRPEGFLVLGKTETMLEPARIGFRSILPRERVYQKLAKT